MNEMNTCSKCGSEKIIPDVSVTDQVGHSIRLGVNVYEHPEAQLFKGAHSSVLHYRMCGDCGIVESYVPNPQEFYEIYLSLQKPTE